jgi:ATP-dependent DNA helicase DinG
VDPLFDALEAVCQREGPDGIRLGGESGLEPRSEVAVAEGLEALFVSFNQLAGELRKLRERIQGDESWSEIMEGRVLDLFSVQSRLEASAQGARRVLDPREEEDGLVRWLELRGRGPGGVRNLAMAAAPIQVGPILREDLWERLETSVLTSATLTTRAGFEYLRTRLGLDTEGMDEGRPVIVEEAVVPSPFDFQTQSLLAVPTDLVGPQEPGDIFQEQTARIVRETTFLTGGGLFVLFTAHSALRRVAELLRASEEGLPGPLFVQGEAPRARLLAQFVASGRGVLLGTASFWEGVDVPGDPLRGLIIQKLPFQVPTEPIVQARLEAVAAQGGDPFWRYTLPEAALRLKQGFGRLIRTREDRGAVLVLDNRILTRRYGPYLRQSLPPAPLTKGLWPEVRRVLQDFYGEG